MSSVMEHQLLVASLGLALIVAVGAFLFPALRGDIGTSADTPPNKLRPAEIAAGILPFLGFLLTLPSHAPFAPGQGLGRGFLIGGIGAIIAGLAARRMRTTTAGGTVIALPVVAVGITLLLLRSVLLDALLGVGIGWFAVAALMYFARRDEPTFNAEAILAGAGFAATLVATALLGTLRDPRTAALPKGTWSTAAIVFAAGASLFVLTTGLLRNSVRTAASVGALGLTAVIAVLLGIKFVDEKRLIALLVIGLLLYPLILWLLNARSTPSNEATPRLRLIPQFAGATPYLGVLLVVSVVMVGGQLMQGYGFALALIAMYAAWAIVGGAIGEGGGGLRLLLFGTALVLYRAFLARWSDDVHGVNLGDQYELFGFVVGAAAPALIGGFAAAVRLGRPEGARPLITASVAGLLILAVPACVLLIFGPKCALALLLGAAVAGVFTADYLPLLITIGIALAMDQWTNHVLPYADAARLVKLKALAVIFAITIVTVAISAGRRSADTTGTNEEPTAR